MKIQLDPRMAEAISTAVYATIAIVGINGLLATSMFQSSRKAAGLKRAA